MLRLLVIVLLAANVLFFGYSRGWFDGLGDGWFGGSGLRALGDRDPERLTRQVRPETIVLMPMNAASATASNQVDGETCLEAGPIGAADAALAEAALRGVLAPGAWIDRSVEAGDGGAAPLAHSYRVPRADSATAARLMALRLDPSGHGFSVCAKSEPAR
ncbi:MAG: hypothetical protein M3Z29_12265 [Pseudomonadota bacterium]|nr:hypothetical protein [Pseudomonadota bacterium]